MRKCVIWVAIGLLAGCQTYEATHVQGSPSPADIEPMIAGNLAPEACSLGGHWQFFESFVRSAHIRRKYTAPSLMWAITPFRIAAIDNQWIYVGDDAEQPSERLDLNSELRGDKFRVDYVRAEFDANDEVISRSGSTGSYVFWQENGCWRLVDAKR